MGPTPHAPIKLLALFIVLAGLPLAALGWLGWRLLDQDRALEDQRQRERLENAVSILAHESERALMQWEELLPTAVPEGGVLLVFDSRGLVHQQGIRLPFYPLVSSGPEAPTGVFAAGEAKEFRDELAAASVVYRNLTATQNRPQRAGALMRLARCLRKQRQFHDAMAVYEELKAMGDTPIAGTPAELMARHEIVEVLKRLGNMEAAKSEAASLAAVLGEGRLRIDRETFAFYSESTPPKTQTSDASRLAETAQAFWPRWRDEPAGRAAASSDGQAFATVWHRTPGGTAAIVGSIDSLMAPAAPVIQSLQVRLALLDPSGRILWGGGSGVSKSYRETGLPWTIGVAAADPSGARQVWETRRNLLSAGFALMILVIAASGYFVFRAVHRELSVARLQSDFVSAVSHEFRTPLTAMRHIADVLEEGGVLAERLPQYYHVLGRETRRLHAMVENLLDFGRMEAGRRTYSMEDLSVTELVRQVVDEFRDISSSVARRLELRAPVERFPVHADPEAIALAVRNLLDNAIKYSPESSPVNVSVERRGDLTGISVEDQGPGIPEREQREVFRKFVRGASARSLNVKGTGIGLAMADQIVKAHGGKLELASEPGHGSRFTILLPAQPDHK